MNKLTTSVFAVAALIIGTLSASALTSPTTQAVSCVDIDNPQNIHIIWPDRKGKPGTVQIKTPQQLPVCKDTTLWFSAFTLPKNYDNSGWFGIDPNGVSHPTSYPQTATAHTRIDIKAGTVLNKTYTVAEVDLCKTAAQYDVYHRAEKISTIKTEKGIFEHSGVKWSSGFVAIKDNSARCNPPAPEKPAPEKPVIPTPPIVSDPPVIPVPETPKTPEVPAPETPIELPHTGMGSTAIIALLSGSAVAAFMYFIRRN